MKKYDLTDFNNIFLNGFDFKLSEELIENIQNLSFQLGSTTNIKQPVFKKGDRIERGERLYKNEKNEKKKNFDEWETIKSYKSTKIEVKQGLDGKIDLIRSYLNKISEKNYEEQYKNISIILNELTGEEENMMKVGTAIFEIASNNRFYSKLYADLYTRLIIDFDLMKTIFENNLLNYLDVFNNIESANSEENYDMFCKINRDNEKRKSLSSFFINLTINGVISKEKIIELSFNLLNKVLVLIKEKNRKSEVDEIIENISILYKKEWFQNLGENFEIDGLSFIQHIESLASSSTKKYNSLTSKSIFKLMYIVEL